jgi:phosphatidylserine/phosphatidylglycerophosphate/cardiolipin synthase-like enzyme
MTKFIEDWEFPPNMAKARTDLNGLSLKQLGAISFEELGRFKQAGRFPDGYSTTDLTFYAPRDPGVHAVIVWALLQATHTVAVNMYGFDDPQVAAIIQGYTENPDIVVTLSLDKSQAGGKSEKELLERFKHELIGNSIAIGHSSRGAISHDKLVVVDGLYLITGSTNWSQGGEQLQDNQLTLSRVPLAAAEARAIIDLDHDDMLKQMAASAAGEGPPTTATAIGTAKPPATTAPKATKRTAKRSATAKKPTPKP